MIITATNNSFTVILDDSPIQKTIALDQLVFCSQNGELSFHEMFANVNALAAPTNACYHAVIAGLSVTPPPPSVRAGSDQQESSHKAGLSVTPPPPSVRCTGKFYVSSSLQPVDNFWYESDHNLSYFVTVLNHGQVLKQSCDVNNKPCVVAFS